MVEIRHVSVSVSNPERAASILAEITGGQVRRFRSPRMNGACWDENLNHLIEFLPNSYLMFPTEYGADFKEMDTVQNFNSTHFLLEVDLPMSKIKEVADRYGCENRFRPKCGGPLYDVWIEEQFLVEFSSDEIRQYEKVDTN